MLNIDELSGGEMQHVQIARAIVQQTRILLLDEPTNNLDLANQWKIMHLITEILRTRKLCCVTTMHDINTSMQYSDELAFIRRGEIVTKGSPDVVTADVKRASTTSTCGSSMSGA